jgi:hypothetical protein
VFADNGDLSARPLPPLSPSWYADIETDDYSAEISGAVAEAEDLDAVIGMTSFMSEEGAVTVEDTTVRGLPAKLVHDTEAELTDSGPGAADAALYWFENGALLSIHGTFPEDELRKIAESLEFVDQATWAAEVDY